MPDVTKILQVIQKNFEQIRASCLEEGTSSYEEDSEHTPTPETERSDREYMEWKNWRERESERMEMKQKKLQQQRTKEES